MNRLLSCGQELVDLEGDYRDRMWKIVGLAGQIVIFISLLGMMMWLIWWFELVAEGGDFVFNVYEPMFVMLGLGIGFCLLIVGELSTLPRDGASVAAPNRCPNCNSPITGAFCSNCGVRVK